MPINIIRCRIGIGNIFTILNNLCKPKSELILCNYNTAVFYFVRCMVLALFICVDVVLNPGPKNTKPSYNFSLCHWNLSSLLAQGSLNYH